MRDIVACGIQLHEGFSCMWDLVACGNQLHVGFSCMWESIAFGIQLHEGFSCTCVISQLVNTKLKGDLVESSFPSNSPLLVFKRNKPLVSIVKIPALTSVRPNATNGDTIGGQDRVGAGAETTHQRQTTEKANQRGI